MLFVAAGIVAVLDWVAVERRYFRLEYLLKPLTLALLLVATLGADLGDPKPWIVAGLVFGLLGDVALLSDAPPAFLAGLGSFLIGHVAYLIGLARAGLHGVFLVAGALVVIGVAGLALPAVLRAAARSEGRAFAGIVAGYAALLAAMTVCAIGTGHPLVAIGGALFLVSDTVLAHNRFVGPVPRGPLVVIVTYHLAQFLIVLGLVASV